MKRLTGEKPSVKWPGRFLLGAMIFAPSMNVLATEFIEIIRMMDNHPSVRSAQSASSAALFDIEQAKAGNNLQLSAGISSTGYSGQPGSEDNYISPHVSVSKTLYDHGRVDDMVKGRTAAWNMQQAQVIATRENLNQQALSLYTSALSSARVVKVLDKEIAALQGLLSRVKMIATIDSGRASEINQVATRLNSVIASREASNLAGQQAWAQLSQMLGTPITLTSGLPDLKKTGLLPASLEQAERVLTDNPSLVAMRYKRDEAMAALQLAMKWNRPQWNLQLTVNSPRRNGDLEPFKAVTLQVSSDVSLWDGGKGRAAQGGETQRLAAAEQDVEASLRMLKQHLAQLWVSIPLRERQIDALHRQSTAALQIWKSGEEQFFAGTRPLSDLISFVTDYYSSLASYEEQRIYYQASQWQIVSALGKMGELVNKVPSLPSDSMKKGKNSAPKTNRAEAPPVISSQDALTRFQQAVSRGMTTAAANEKATSEFFVNKK